jgi:hypothetical protein
MTHLLPEAYSQMKDGNEFAYGLVLTVVIMSFALNTYYMMLLTKSAFGCNKEEIDIGDKGTKVKDD